jgi:hypothetical protein
MEGNMDYALLKAIENGASLKFVLSYRNTENLKEDIILNKYYSIDYAIWEAELVERYHELNELLKGVQTSIIVKHEFIDTATRIPDNDELEDDAKAAIEAAIKLEKELKEAEEVAYRESLKVARKYIIDTAVTNPISTVVDKTQSGTVAFYHEFLKNHLYASFEKTLEEYKTAKASGDSVAIAAATEALVEAISSVYDTASQVINIAKVTATKYENAVAGYKLIVDENAYTEKIRAELKEMIEVNEPFYKEVLTYIDSTAEIAERIYGAVIAVDSEFEVSKFNRDAVVDIPADEPTEDEETGEETTEEPTENEGEEATEGDEIIEDEVVEDDKADAEEEVFSKYATDKNKIVYEVYENGTSFILNFNNYSVSVTLPANGVTYTIEPYGYIVVNMAS